LPDIAFSYKKSTLNIVNNGHTIQVNYDKGSSIKVDGMDYELVQFHFHNPSEHTVSGKAFANEMHLVHRNAKGGLAVVGVLIEAGKEAASFKDIWANLPGKADEKRSLHVTINADELLPKARTFYRYTGSLTTPPCSEGVTWLVLKTPVQMSEAQLKAFNDIFKVNNRPVQPVNDRQIKADTATH
ncbi:MAG: carbonic anhydrase family protein, partial [Deltaproteobacteria bacterium]|nr:carbonic anhydrase family protein [Deltaproteobacteria bacterium]